MKDLIVGKSYAILFGYDVEKGKDIIYEGGYKFRIINKERGIDTIQESKKTFEKIKDLINRPNIKMGSLG